MEGLLSQFPGKVSLVGGAADGRDSARRNGVEQIRHHRKQRGVSARRQVAGNLADEIRAAYRALTATNKVAGTALDLRFAGGDDTRRRRRQTRQNCCCWRKKDPAGRDSGRWWCW